MSVVTWQNLAGLVTRANLWSQFIWEISACLIGMKFKKENCNSEKNWIVHDCRSFVTLLLHVKLIHKLVKWKYIQDKNCAILGAILRKQSCFLKKGSSQSPGLECS